MGLLNPLSDLVRLTCANCLIEFGITRGLYGRRVDDRNVFYCPNGHQQYFPGKSADEKRIAALEREVREAKERAEREARSRKWAETRAKGANIAAGKAKAQMQRTLTRVHAGVCPHCNRTFKQLAAHMEAKHGSVN